jgi:hypothetical protein
MTRLMHEQVQSWIALCNCIADIGEHYPDQFEEGMSEIGMDEYEASMIIHEIEGTDWDRYPGLMRAYKRILPLRQRLTKGITFTHETGWSDHPTPLHYDPETDDLVPGAG